MDYYKNIDHFCHPNPKRRTEGINYDFIDESDYEEPVTLDAFKDYASIDGDSYDAEIETILTGARIACENYLQRSLGLRTVQFSAMYVTNEWALAWSPYEPVDELFNNILLTGGEKFSIELETTDKLGKNQSIQLAIMKQAKFEYDNREKFVGGGQEITHLQDEVKSLLKPFKFYSAI